MSIPSVPPEQGYIFNVIFIRFSETGTMLCAIACSRIFCKHRSIAKSFFQKQVTFCTTFLKRNFSNLFASCSFTIKNRFRSFADNSSSCFFSIIMICYYKGVRIAECTGLTWDRVDLKNGTITIDRILVKDAKSWYLGSPKTDSSASEYSGRFYTAIPADGNRRSSMMETAIPE